MYDTNEIYHHGVKGMSWGKRNGPPYPLDAEGKASLRKQRMESYGKSITKGGGDAESREQKKAAKAENKELEKQVKKSQVYKNNKMMNQMRAKKRVQRDTAIGGIASGAVGLAVAGPVGGAAGILGGALVTSIASSTINKGRQIYENSKFKNMKVSEIKEKRAYANEFASLSKKEQQKRLSEYDADDYYDSKAREEASSRAYNKTYEYLKKEDPDYLKNIISKNNGSKEGLDAFHDFRKIYEGYEDEEWIKGEKEFKALKEIKKKKDNTNITDKAQYIKTRNSFSTDERKDLWEDAMSRANDSKLTDKQRAYAKQEANRIKAVEERNKNYKSPNNGKYDITFLEAIQNKEILEYGDTKTIDAEYVKYKQNPEKYFTEEANKLRDI